MHAMDIWPATKHLGSISFTEDTQATKATYHHLNYTCILALKYLGFSKRSYFLSLKNTTCNNPEHPLTSRLEY